ncbi:MAG: IS21-like element helper ATPase IstB [Alphaproteobacteria bacterium]|nr:IS21-like element helper ATPase IstB [Alphaproteobacteria bacterium]
MLAHPTLDQLRALGLHGMAKAFVDAGDHPDAAALSHAEWLALLRDRESALRADKRLSARVRYAKLRQQASPEDIDYRAVRGLERKLMQSLLDCGWIKQHENVLICGPTGVGKSYIACALGHKACRDNHAVLSQSAPKLFPELALARGDGRYGRMMRTLCRVEVLVLDDWGLERLDAEGRHDLLELLEDRHGRGSIVVTSQLPVDRWHDMIGDQTYADAILDRLVHNAHRITLVGESMRRPRQRVS